MNHDDAKPDNQQYSYVAKFTLLTKFSNVRGSAKWSGIETMFLLGWKVKLKVIKFKN